MAINAGIILIRSILGPRSLGLFLLAINFCSRESERTERCSEERGTEVKSGQEKTKEKSCREVGGEEKDGDKLLDRELVACSSKKNWKSVALDRPDDIKGERRMEERQLWDTIGPSVSFLLSSVQLPPSSLPSFE